MASECGFPSQDIGSLIGKFPAEETFMLWLLYVAWWTDLIGLVPGARPEARLLPAKSHEALPTQHKAGR